MASLASEGYKSGTNGMRRDGVSVASEQAIATSLSRVFDGFLGANRMVEGYCVDNGKLSFVRIERRPLFGPIVVFESFGTPNGLHQVEYSLDGEFAKRATLLDGGEQVHEQRGITDSDAIHLRFVRNTLRVSKPRSFVRR